MLMKFNNSKLIENKPCKRYCPLLINLKLELKKKYFFIKKMKETQMF